MESGNDICRSGVDRAELRGDENIHSAHKPSLESLRQRRSQKRLSGVGPSSVETPVPNLPPEPHPVINIPATELAKSKF